MEVRRAMFLRACNHNLEKMAYPLGFRAALGGFLVGCVELGMSDFSKWWALKVMARTGNEKNWEWVVFQNGGGKSKHIELTEELGRNRDICRKIKQKSKARDSRTDRKVIVLLNSWHISSLFAWNNVRWELKIHVSYSSWFNFQFLLFHIHYYVLTQKRTKENWTKDKTELQHIYYELTCWVGLIGLSWSERFKADRRAGANDPAQGHA